MVGGICWLYNNFIYCELSDNELHITGHLDIRRFLIYHYVLTCLWQFFKVRHCAADSWLQQRTNETKFLMQAGVRYSARAPFLCFWPLRPLKMKALYPFETSGASYQLVRRHNPQERSCPAHRIKVSQGNRGHCATSRKVGVRHPVGVIGTLRWHNHSGRTMALRSTQPLTEMSTRDVSWDNSGRCVRQTTLPPSCAYCLEIIGASAFWSTKEVFFHSFSFHRDCSIY